jgi:hypothetical protein
MREIQGFFDKLYFSESVLGHGHMEGERLIVPIRGLFVLAGHPLQADGGGPYEGELVFDGVLDSRRTVTEYIGDSRKPEGFKAPREVVDEVSIVQAEDVGSTQQYGFEGYQDEPSAWIDNWIVQAHSFKLVLAALPST